MRREFEGTYDDVQSFMDHHSWGDGLPLIPPTEERVMEMLHGRDPRETVGSIPPADGNATLEIIASNAVMAGCAPTTFPIVIAALRAMLEPAFNLGAIQTTTHPAAPLLIVHGPIAAQVGINSASGLLGPGFSANSTIGRAIRLVLMNVGLARPGAGDHATQGTPAKYSFCMAENLVETPWPAFHTTVGFTPSDSAVTVVGVEGPHNVQDHESADGARFANLLADVMRALGHNGWYLSDGNECVVVLGPEHAQMLARDGWTRRDLQMYLFLRACRRAAEVAQGGLWKNRSWPRWMAALAAQDSIVPPVRDPSEIIILVAGGAGKQSLFIPSAGLGHAITRRVES